ncbi:hypothetical protein PTSG_01172 [Salpingoeca rosetta]|uniref:25S rRNA (uridine-N(3))-methyltransferase BMT5-like domain-containing protein n=1 Tax=Salpingoeca rosetta (strain ATCC 50818 / BSB-021) TaxID=946362 RepID=F2U105_SALR5|nr:uncharacterized protein PTSG_01172 [Salpingoeca rosetta]EGD80579.1 hypothetical protein PTSG_01172 [Salpingoeca rosetta]|eukprot:XP_004997140.1 hypothetical protein PTSG_01172 [Salpingoeca rosetta]
MMTGGSMKLDTVCFAQQGLLCCYDSDGGGDSDTEGADGRHEAARGVQQQQQRQQQQQTQKQQQQQNSTHKTQLGGNENHRVLILGDGNLSFAHSVATRLLDAAAESSQPAKIVATTYDTEDMLLDRHPDSVTHLLALRAMPELVNVQTGVDATNIASTLDTQAAGHDVFDEIVFTFPHVGGKCPIGHNRDLLCGFFASAKCCLAPRGVICLTLAVGQGGTSFDAIKRPRKGDHWQAVELAATSEFRLVGARPFLAHEFKHYTCSGRRSTARTFRTDGATTLFFTHNPPPIKDDGQRHDGIDHNSFPVSLQAPSLESSPHFEPAHDESYARASALPLVRLVISLFQHCWHPTPDTKMTVLNVTQPDQPLFAG